MRSDVIINRQGQMGNLLIKERDEVTKRTGASSTLIRASEHGYLEIVQTLLGRGADVHKSNFDGDTALHKASEKGHIEVVRALLEAGAGADVRRRNEYGYLVPVRGSTWRYSEPWWRREET